MQLQCADKLAVSSLKCFLFSFSCIHTSRWMGRDAFFFFQCSKLNALFRLFSKLCENLSFCWKVLEHLNNYNNNDKQGIW